MFKSQRTHWQNAPAPQNPFLVAYRGSFVSLLRWPEVDLFWKTFLNNPQDDWYIYAVGEPPPDATSEWEKTLHFVKAIDALVRKDHQEDYCGIIYVDDRQHPTFIKIFDPNNLGVSCGFSESPPFPGWILSKIPPVDLSQQIASTASRKRWWQNLFSR